MTPPDRDDRLALYARRRQRHRAEAEALEGRSRRLSLARLGLFLATLVAFAAAVVGTPTPRTPWLVAAGLALAGFAVAVVAHARLARHLARERALAEVNRRAEARARRRWDELPLAPPPPPDAPSFARDLALFDDPEAHRGRRRGSLARLLGTVGTLPGRRHLARWLVEPAGTEEVRRRQAVVARLVDRLDERQELEARAAILRHEDVPGNGNADAGFEGAGFERFLAWAEAEPWLLDRPALLWGTRVLAVLILASAVATVAGWLPLAVPLALAALGYLASAVASERIHEAFDRATAGVDTLRGLGPVLAALAPLLEAGDEAGNDKGSDGEDDGPEAARALADLARRLESDGRSAAEHMERLDRLVVLSDARRGLIHFFVQLLTLWDFHLLARFEAWQQAAGRRVRHWLDALGEAEALAALAALAHAQPDWATPRLVAAEGSTMVEAEALGHPLMDPDQRVDNDLHLGPAGSFLLVTGSNMSGKTTFLRALGTNVVLAQAGAPVCAEAFTLPPLALVTSIVIEDSLDEGVSFYMAELLRLKAVVDLADDPPPGRRVCYLLDEILRGTNSGERRVAIQRVLAHLLETPALGVVTTHDLEILAEGELAGAARPIHFRETITPRPGGGAVMSFDYVARPGLSPTTNALDLLAAVGLGDRDTEGPMELAPGPRGRGGPETAASETTGETVEETTTRSGEK